ncbi:LysR family transcriptional regulator [Noviherbaspirillum malthae]|uniref:LysR family transcriptional regulator n=1 Tax=Noviherbaspirillum malthae TaxID=1260987 RepID=UPI00188F58B6|nr:LysR family transcriptional regulator [Noviherbaspirillum malthae]
MHGIDRLSNKAAMMADLTHAPPTALRAFKRTSFRIDVKDWRVLHAVVDCGTFASAASVLHMSQPAVSYTVAKLEQQIGVALFRQAGRRACLTPQGKALVERSRALVKEAYDVEEFAINLMQMCNQDIRLLVDKDFPTNLLAKALRQIEQQQSYVNVALLERSVTAIEQTLIDRGADLAITSKIPSGLTGTLLVEIHYVPVAHPRHPLFRSGRTIELEELQTLKEVRIAMDASDSTNFSKHPASRSQPGTNRTWEVHNFDTAINIVSEGLAYAWLPKTRVASLLSQKKLRVLPLQRDGNRVVRYYLVSGHGLGDNMAVTYLSTALCDLIRTDETP